MTLPDICISWLALLGSAQHLPCICGDAASGCEGFLGQHYAIGEVGGHQGLLEHVEE